MKSLTITRYRSFSRNKLHDSCKEWKGVRWKKRLHMRVCGTREAAAQAPHYERDVVSIPVFVRVYYLHINGDHLVSCSLFHARGILRDIPEPVRTSVLSSIRWNDSAKEAIMRGRGVKAEKKIGTTRGGDGRTVPKVKKELFFKRNSPFDHKENSRLGRYIIYLFICFLNFFLRLSLCMFSKETSHSQL